MPILDGGRQVLNEIDEEVSQRASLLANRFGGVERHYFVVAKRSKTCCSFNHWGRHEDYS